MPYVNIPYSNLAGGIAVIVGKIQGNIAGKIVGKTANIQKQFKAKGCPSKSELARIKSKQAGLTSNLSKINSRLSKFSKIPKAIKPPLSGLKAALKIILTLPMPQGVGIPPGPPGGLIFGLPINITTKYADTMHLIKELIKQIDEQVLGIEAVLETPALFTATTRNVLKRTEGAVKCCEVQAALQDELDKGNLSKKNMKDLELMDEDEIFIFSKLGPVFVGGEDIDKIGEDSSASDSLKDDAKSEDDFLGLLIPADKKGRPKGQLTDLAKDLLKEGGIKGATDLQSEKDKRREAARILDNALKKLETGLKSLEPIGREGFYIGEEIEIDGIIFRWNGTAWIKVTKTDTGLTKGLTEKSLLKDSTGEDPLKDLKDRLRELLALLTDVEKEKTISTEKFKHIGPNGEVYDLEIINDIEGSTIAPKRFAVAKDFEGTIVLKGPKSFSSSIDILLEEIKFRIDNQLP